MINKSSPFQDQRGKVPIEVIHFAKNLRAARLSAGISQRELGRITGVSQGVVSEHERGLRLPRICTMIKLARAVHVPLWQLLKPT